MRKHREKKELIYKHKQTDVKLLQRTGQRSEVRFRIRWSGLWFSIWSDLHLSEPEWVLPARPAGPLHAISVGGVASSQVLAVQVGGVAVTVPPCPLIVCRTVVLWLVLVSVFSGELHPRVLQEGITLRRDEHLLVLRGAVYYCRSVVVAMVFVPAVPEYWSTVRGYPSSSGFTESRPTAKSAYRAKAVALSKSAMSIRNS